MKEPDGQTYLQKFPPDRTFHFHVGSAGNACFLHDVHAGREDETGFHAGSFLETSKVAGTGRSRTRPVASHVA